MAAQHLLPEFIGNADTIGGFGWGHHAQRIQPLPMSGEPHRHQRDALHLGGVFPQIPQAAAKLLAVIEPRTDNDLGVDADMMGCQLRDILEHLAAAGVFHQLDPQLGVGGVNRNIDGADVHFDDAGNILITHVGEGDIAAEQKAHAAVVIFEVEGFPHTLGKLIDKAEHAFIGAVVLPIHEIIGKFQTQLVIFRLFNVEGEELVLPLHLDGEGGVDHVEAVIQHVANDIAVDGEEPVAGMDTGFCRGGMGGNAIDKNRHFDFISGSDQILYSRKTSSSGILP